MQKSLPPFYIERYEEFMYFYIRGEWKKALVIVTNLENERREFILKEFPDRTYIPDGPSQLISEYIESHKAIPPVNWIGARPLE